MDREFVESRRSNDHERNLKMPAQTRCDVRTLATIARYFESKGYNIVTQSQLVRLALEELRLILVFNGASDVVSSYEAQQTLEGFGIAGFTFNGRSGATHQKALERDAHIPIPEGGIRQNIMIEAERLMKAGTIDAIRKQVEGELEGGSK